MNRFTVAPLLLLVTALTGCAHQAGWPAEPEQFWGTPENPQAVLYAPEGGKGGKYLQTYRHGMKRTLYYDAKGDGNFIEVADLDELDIQEIRHVFILLDGVPYNLFRELYDEGHFRLFYPPAMMVSPFPSLTDISFSSMFELSGTSCYEPAIYDPTSNTFHGTTKIYLRGDNELWASKLDYRQRNWLDGVSYIFPKYSARREFTAMFRKADSVLNDRAQQRHVLIYALAPDSACHMLSWDEVKQVMIDLDRRIERLLFDHRGQLGIVMFSDHGNNFISCKRADLEGAAKRAGLRPVHEKNLRKSKEVLIPRYGLISLARAFCQTQEDRQVLIKAWLEEPGVEHVMWHQDGVANVATRDARAEIRREVVETEAGRAVYYSYLPIEGDPLELLPLLEALKPQYLAGDETPYYEAGELLRVTAEHEWPDPLHRIWGGLNDRSAVIPDVVASLGYGWYYGSTGLDMFAKLKGTHGGLRRLDSNTFFTATLFAPPEVMRVDDLLPVINQHFPWRPPSELPSCHGLERYFKRENPMDGSLRNLR